MIYAVKTLRIVLHKVIMRIDCPRMGYFFAQNQWSYVFCKKKKCGHTAYTPCDRDYSPVYIYIFFSVLPYGRSVVCNGIPLGVQGKYSWWFPVAFPRVYGIFVLTQDTELISVTPNRFDSEDIFCQAAN